MIAPIQPQPRERRRDKFAYASRPSGGDDIVSRHLEGEDAAHGIGIFRAIAPVDPRFEITEVETIAVSDSIRILPVLRRQFGNARWRKRKGFATVRLADGTIR